MEETTLFSKRGSYPSTQWAKERSLISIFLPVSKITLTEHGNLERRNSSNSTGISISISLQPRKFPTNWTKPNQNTLLELIVGCDLSPQPMTKLGKPRSSPAKRWRRRERSSTKFAPSFKPRERNQRNANSKSCRGERTAGCPMSIIRSLRHSSRCTVRERCS